MIAHIAEAGEARGRVVLQVCSSRPSLVALEAAIRVAQAYRSEVESLFVEDLNLLQLASFPFAQEVTFSGKARPLSLDDMESEFRNAFRALQRRIEVLAAAADVPVKRRIVRDDPLDALRKACTECGPWNLIALADPFTSASGATLQWLFESIADATGLLIVGPGAQRLDGRIVVMSDETEHLGNMLRVAQRLAALDHSQVVISLIAASEEEIVELEAGARLLLEDQEGFEICSVAVVRDEAAASEVLRRQRPGFVITRYGGLLVPEDGNLRALSLALECPLLMVR